MNNNELYEMANIQPNRTGIKAVLYSKYDGVNTENNTVPKIIAKINNESFSIKLKPVKIETNTTKLPIDVIYKINEILEYINRNEDLFIEHWNGKIDDVELILALESRKMENIARIGFTDDGFEVYINTDDGGNIPHFHYRTKGTWKFHTCIRLDSPEYFHHDGKEGILNSKQRKELVKFLNSTDLHEQDKTHWQVLLKEWNRNNSNIEIDEETPMPDYLNLK